MAEIIDQRWVRREGKEFFSGASNHTLCSMCGDQELCTMRRGLNFMKETWGLRTTVDACSKFMPIIAFVDSIGLSGSFNTFRRGFGLYRRMMPGCWVRLYDKTANGFVSYGVVKETHCGVLKDLLPVHAAYNHSVLDIHPSKAQMALQNVLHKIYGRNYSAPDTEYSVIYIEAVNDRPVGRD